MPLPPRRAPRTLLLSSPPGPLSIAQSLRYACVPFGDREGEEKGKCRVTFGVSNIHLSFPLSIAEETFYLSRLLVRWRAGALWAGGGEELPIRPQRPQLLEQSALFVRQMR